MADALVVAMLASASVPLSVVAQEPAAPDVCNKGFAHWVKMYQGCVAHKAHEFEITGDSAESIATAAVGACSPYRAKLVEYMDTCDPGSGNIRVGEETMKKMEPEFRDFAIQSVIQFRADRISGKPRPEKSN